MIDKDTMRLSEQVCNRDQQNIGKLDDADIAKLLKEIHQDWIAHIEQRQLVRVFRFKGFAKALQTANVIAWLGDQQGHHPDINFGWGYCVVKFSTHDIDGLSINDFICAAKVDVLMAG
jgi:4a-hydroxytetrahydrobiopterin dehydratase